MRKRNGVSLSISNNFTAIFDHRLDEIEEHN